MVVLQGENSMKNAKIFLLMKSESAPYVEHIEPILNKYQLQMEARYFVEDWISIARNLYKQRIASESPEFETGFEGHLWLSKFLFGHRGVLAILKPTQGASSDLLDMAQRANSAKSEFRDLLSQTRNGTILMTMNIALIPEIQIQGNILAGYLGVKKANNEFVQIETTTEGTWDYFYLKYIHVPSPTLNEIHYEWTVIQNFGLIDNKNCLSDSDWKTILNTNSFFRLNQNSYDK